MKSRRDVARPLRLLIAVDAFGDEHIQALCEAASGRAVCDRLGQDASADEYRRAMAAAEVMVGWPDPDLLAASPLRLLLLPSAGYEEYLTPELAARDDLVVCNAGGAYSEGVAEHCVAMMLALVRRLPEYLRAMPGRSWEHLHRHGRLAGSTVCVIGLGTLGSAIAWRCAALGMRVVGVRQHPDRPCPNVSEVFGPEALVAAVAEADHVVGALPGGATTRGLISREVLAAMKPGAYLYNVGRGPSVDETALVERLAGGHLAGAGLDVFAVEPLPDDSPLWAMENVIVTPHMAGYTWDYADELCDVFAANLARHSAGEPLHHVVDLSPGAAT
ncbi:MAG: D-2-hydroxyacid dehydrogenase [Acidimicrobiaceae bacterium]|nr:D-2-hydroxyacid dehydrogenase [Acidimicrobiaceae bacterium]MYH77096.1 D-2-hydroxyacid dehydrogenase [Acidimicrobiaceae bacterium]MYK77746.1 D-2-hydroxyacid dehydrogenase [Acidimicrobiaceae bacterium]